MGATRALGAARGRRIDGGIDMARIAAQAAGYAALALILLAAAVVSNLDSAAADVSAHEIVSETAAG